MGKAQRKAARGRSASDDADGFVGFIQDVELLEKFINSEVNKGDLSALDAAKESGPKKSKRQGRKKSTSKAQADSKGNAGDAVKEIIDESKNESFEECPGPSTGDSTDQKSNKKKSASKKKKQQNDEEKEVMAVPTEEVGSANNRWANLETEKKASPKKKKNKKTKKNKKPSSSRSESTDWFDAVEKLGDDEVSSTATDQTDQSDNASELPDNDDDGWSTVSQKKKKALKEKAMKPLASPLPNQPPVKPFTKWLPRKQPFSPFQSKVAGGAFQKNPPKVTMGSSLATSTGSSSSTRNSFSSASSSSVTTTSKCSEVLTANGDLPAEKVDAGVGDSDGKLVGTSFAKVLDNSDPFPPLPLYFSKSPEVSGKEEKEGSSKLLDSGEYCWLKPASPLPQAQGQDQVTPISEKSITDGIAAAEVSADQLPNSHSTQPGLCELKEPSPSGYQQPEVCQAEVGPFQENQWPNVVDSGTAIFIDDSNGDNSSNNSFSSSFSPSSTDANSSEVVTFKPSSEPYQSDLPIENFDSESFELLDSTFARVLNTIDHLRETCEGKALDNGQRGPKSFAFNFDPPAESFSTTPGEIHDQCIVPSFGFFEDSQLVSLVLGKADSLNEAEPVVFATGLSSSSSSLKSAVSSADAQQKKKEEKEVQKEVKEEKMASPSISGAIIKISITTFDNPTSTVFVSCVDQLEDYRFVDKVNSGSYNYQDVVEYVSKTWSDVKSVITSLADV